MNHVDDRHRYPTAFPFPVAIILLLSDHAQEELKVTEVKQAKITERKAIFDQEWMAPYIKRSLCQGSAAIDVQKDVAQSSTRAGAGNNYCIAYSSRLKRSNCPNLRHAETYEYEE
ncbi:hypothetical protein E4U59_003277 [Claviceps monticola]|nr:hypothetical protein E4U59_003277 [Claviceps monticola]